ncbi:hypothetical protein KUV62_10575 [Salipiger bermudensis]|uniref:hypothetical protein n=1 Tax=Salipiger bermudensis TaxID=344736 RepID=UPI001C99CE0D|nr:hypothetical protein [Salipiger bermudensis]MBY6004355.1 hypothetical protein [Salipiger bermudensis]
MGGQERAYGGLRLERVVAPVLVALACLLLFVWPALPESLPQRLVSLAAVLLVAYCIFDAKVLRVLWKAALVAAPISLLGLASVLALLPVIDGIETGGAQNPRYLYQGLMAGGVVAAGWVFTFLVQTWREESARDKALNETLLALRSEVFDYLSDLLELWERPAPDRASEEARLKALIATMLGHDARGRSVAQRIAEEGYEPFVPSGKEPVVLTTLAPNLQLLPDDVMQPVIGFYTQLGDVQRLAQDLNGAAYRRLGRARRAEIYFDFEEVRLQTVRVGCQAWLALNARTRPQKEEPGVFGLLAEADTSRARPDFEALVPAGADDSHTRDGSGDAERSDV